MHSPERGANPSAGEGRVPASFAQRRLWFLDRLEGGGSAYIIPRYARLVGRLDRAALGRALDRIVARHQALRTTIHANGGEPVQRIRPAEASGFPLLDHDLRGRANAETELRRLVAEEAGAPFDLERGPLVRGRLVRMADDEHVLLLTFHHVVIDGWSLGLFAGELNALYAAFARGVADPLPPVDAQYADYAAWQRGRTEEEEYARQVEYWRGALAGAPAVLELPTDRSRPARQDFAGGWVPFSLDRDLAGRLEATARRHDTTLFTAVLAAWAVVLGRLSGQDDLVAGIVTANRDRPEFRGVMGFFANTLPVRLDLSGSPAAAELLGRVRAAQLSARRNQDVPFERLVEIAQPERNPAYAPLAQALVTWDNRSEGTLELPGVAPAPVRRPEPAATKCELALRLGRVDGRIDGGLEYAAALFDRSTVERWAAHLRAALEAIAADDGRPVDRLDLLPPAERRLLLEEWSVGSAEPAEPCVHQTVAMQAARAPEAEALRFGARTVTYGEMDRAANRLAHHLIARGVRLETRVGIFAERAPETIVAILAVLKAGGAYVPLDPAYPAEWLRFALADAGPRTVIAPAGVPEAAAGLVPGLLDLRAEADAVAARPADAPRVEVPADALAYVIYTSGSTGRPKGVMVSHGAVSNMAASARASLGTGPGSRVMQMASLGFDASVLEVLVALTSGAALHAVERATLVDRAALAARVRSEGIDTWIGFPTLLDTLAPEEVPTLRTVVVGGERCGAETAARWAPGRAMLSSYGPTEATVYATEHRADGTEAIPIGRPIRNVRAYVLDRRGSPAPVGVPGELCIGGAQVARGYLDRPALTAERFVPDPFSRQGGARLYRTGDRARWRAGGQLEFLGRLDDQVKVRGFRVEPGEVEAVLRGHPAVREAAVVAREDVPGAKRLAAYVVPSGEAPEAGEVRRWMAERLPEHMVPGALVFLAALPTGPTGKVDRRALPEPVSEGAAEPGAAPSTPVEELLAGIWRAVLGRERVGVRENFFDLGGQSLTLAKVQARLEEALGREIPIVDLFRFPTIAALAAHLAVDVDASPSPAPAGRPAEARRTRKAEEETGAFAVIGMAGRFPGAPDVERFWSNLRGGVNSITFSTPEELEAAGTDPALLRDPAYVGARGVMEGMELFDAAFFGFNPREAEVLDPQHRIFLETAWEALESAGYAPGTAPGAVGIYAGASNSPYLARHVLANPEVVEAVGPQQAELANGREFMVTRAAYKLDLRGPAVSVQTACSTGLVAVHLACRALAAGECDLAVAGGVGIRPGRGHLYAPGGIMSRDGHCRAFDARAAGTVGGNGIGLVVLKRLEDALADGDTIRAVIRGSAINNDGAGKVGFTAPGVDGQAAAITRALEIAEVDPETIAYVEAHGSGTELGDPVEVAALARAFGDTGRKGYCALGSVKTNVGHLDSAVGAAGLIKAVLAVEHGEIPPTLHFSEPNPRIEFTSSPFFVNTELRPWPGDASTPRRAGVSSLGIGGTNAHVVLEQAPPRAAAPSRRPWQLLAVSARTPSALEAASDRLAAHLRAHPEQALADVAHTLQLGRRPFEHRRVLVARDHEEAARILDARAPDRLFTATAPETPRPVAFLFPGLGSHYPGMGRGLYETEPVFRDAVDRCAELLRPYLGEDVREVLYPAGASPEGGEGAFTVDLRAMLGGFDAVGSGNDPSAALNRTRMAQPALFVTEYALYRLWESWGVRPAAMLGHSLGEWVAATVAGVWSLEDALMLVAERARLIEELPAGGMMGIGLTEEEARPFLTGSISVGAVHGPVITVVSGPAAEVDALQAEVQARGIGWRRLPMRHAFHTPLMEPVAERLMELLRGVRMHAPRIPFASNVTGGWIRASEATDPAYWARHLCSTVRFSDGVETMAAGGYRVFVESGPGHALRMLSAQLDVWAGEPPSIVASLRHAYERHPDAAHTLGAAGRLWAAGAAVDWKAIHAGERLGRVPLPTYPFERSRYWLEPRPVSASPISTVSSEMRGGTEKRPDPADWLYLPAWTRAPLPQSTLAEPDEWLVLADEGGIGGRLAGRLEMGGHAVAVAEPGERFARVGDRGYTVRPGSAEDLGALRDALRAAGRRPRRIVLLWGIGPEGADDFARAHARGYATVAVVAAAFGRDPADGPLRLVVVTEGARDVYGGETVHPARATVHGACLALPQEQAHVACRTVDVRLGATGGDRLVDQLLAETAADSADVAVALRGPWRWALGYEAARPREGAGLRAGGGYLFSGSMAGGAEVLAEHLAGMGAGIAVMVDPSFPEPGEWDAVLASASGHAGAASTLRGIRAAEARGGRVILLRAAPGDAAAVRAAIDAAVETFGALHGIVHASAGGAGTEPAPLAEAPPSALAAELARVARELDVLDEATAGLRLDFRLLQNSIFSVFGGPGLAAATAAFVLGEAWAQRRAAEGGGRWTSVSWDRWHLEGVDAAGGFADGAILRGDGPRVFECLAGVADEPGVVVSTQDLRARLARLRAPRRRPAEAGPGAQEAGLHARPALANPYLVPTSEAEELLVGIWRELLGIGEIGIRDSFFDLGGHSLMGIRLLARIRETFQVDLPLRAVFEAPTVADLAGVIDEMILAELDEMSDEEAEAALAGLAGASGPLMGGAA